MTDKSQGTKGISAFVVEKEMPGVTVGENIRRMGIRAASNCEVSYENVRVPAANRLGREGQGFKIAMKALDGGRIGIAAQAVGIAQGALNEAVKYVERKKTVWKKYLQISDDTVQGSRHADQDRCSETADMESC